MIGSKFRNALMAGIAAGFLLNGLQPAAAQQTPQIGVAAAINPDAEGTPPEAETRTLRVGVNIQANERIVTSDNGQAQMLFLDESAFTVGPNSDVVLDEFVFDPSTGTGKIALSAAKGVFRMVGGKISKRTPVTLRTPTAVIGIRGGIALVNVAAGGATQATFLFGDQMTVDTGAGQQAVNRPGFTITADSADAPPSPPAPASNEQLSGSLSSLEGSAPPADDGEGESAGGGQVPTNQRVASSNISALGSNNSPAALGAPAPPAAPPQGPPQGGGVAEDTTTESQQNTKLQDSSTLGLTISTVFKGRFIHATNAAGPATQFGLDLDQTSLDKGFQTGTVSGGTFTADFGGSVTDFVAPVLTTGTSFSTTGGPSGVSFDVTASSQPFGSGTLTGTGTLFSGNEFLLYELTDQGDGHKVIGFAGIPTSTFPTTGATFYRARDDFILGSKFPGIPKQDGGDLSITIPSGAQAAIYWDSSQATTAQKPFGALFGGVTGTGTSQQSVFSLFVGQVKSETNATNVLTGDFIGFSKLSNDPLSPRYFTGDFETQCNCNDSISGLQEFDFYGSNADHFFVTSGDDTSTNVVDPFERRRGIETVQKYNPAIVFNKTTDTLASRTNHLASTSSGFNTSLTGWSGGAGVSISKSTGEATAFRFANSSSNPSDIKIQTSATTNKVNASFAVSKLNSPIDTILVKMGDGDGAFSSSSTSSGHSVFIDDTSIAATDGISGAIGSSQFNSMNVSEDHAGMVSMQDIPGLTGTYCNCKFLTWGLWTAELEPSQVSNIERLIGTFVTGAVQDLTSIPGTGTASYGGHFLANVINNNVSYIEHGNATFSVNFAGASTSGTLSITNFDGGSLSGSFSGVSSASGGGHKFTGSVAGVAGTTLANVNTGSMAGSFFASSSNNVAEVGAHIGASGTVGGNAYSLSGTTAQTCTSGACQ